jgi:alanine-glyoxylate transaminase/serine-glyoxylate transaminase/serine-pyruvate transaminase
MTSLKPLLMIPGPIEVSPAVREAFAAPPPGHLEPRLDRGVRASLERMRRVWKSAPSAQPFVVPGSGTTAMEMAVANLIEPGDAVDRRQHRLLLGSAWSRCCAARARTSWISASSRGTSRTSAGREGAFADLERAGRRVKALFATHVDTSTAARVDPRLSRGGSLAPAGACRLRRRVRDGCRAVRDGAWGADVYLTASQKAIGRAAGARAARRERSGARSTGAPARAAPPLAWDFTRGAGHGGVRGAQARVLRDAADELVMALAVSLREILEDGIEARWAAHARAARARCRLPGRCSASPTSRRAWSIARRRSRRCAIRRAWDASLVGGSRSAGSSSPAALHPRIRAEYFRVGHMGYAIGRTDLLMRTIEAVAFGPRGVRACVDGVARGARLPRDAPGGGRQGLASIT